MSADKRRREKLFEVFKVVRKESIPVKRPILENNGIEEMKPITNEI